MVRFRRKEQQMASIAFNQEVLECLNWSFIEWQQLSSLDRQWVVYCNRDGERILAKRRSAADAWQAAADMALKLHANWSIYYS
jgi:hypothetical protein